MYTLKSTNIERSMIGDEEIFEQAAFQELDNNMFLMCNYNYDNFYSSNTIVVNELNQFIRIHNVIHNNKFLNQQVTVRANIEVSMNDLDLDSLINFVSNLGPAKYEADFEKRVFKFSMLSLTL